MFPSHDRWGIDDSRIDDYINVIVAPPLRPPYIEMLSLDSAEDNQENNMEDRFIQFAYRYKYRDNQYSSLSPFSATAFVPGQFELDYAAGNNEAMLNTKNKVKVIFETGNQFVEEIQVVAFDTKRLNVYIVETFNKVESGIQDQVIPNHDTYSFIFKNNKLYTPLSEKQVTRFFDNVPIAAQAQEVIDSRIVYGNYTQFYDLTDCSGYKVTMNYTVGIVTGKLLVHCQKTL